MKLASVLFTIHSCLAMEAFAPLVKDGLSPKSPIPINHDPRIRQPSFPSHSKPSSGPPSTTEDLQTQSTTDPRIFEINIIPVHATTNPSQPTVNGKPVKLYGVLPHAGHGNQRPSEHQPMIPNFESHGHLPQVYPNQHFGKFANLSQHPTHGPAGTSSPDFVQRYLESLVQSGYLQQCKTVPGETLPSGYPDDVKQPISETASHDVQVYLTKEARDRAEHEAPFDPYDPTEAVRRRYLTQLDKFRGPRDGDPMKINLDVLGLINPKLRSGNFAQQSGFSEKSYDENSSKSKLESQGENLKEISNDNVTTKSQKKKSKGKKVRLGEWINGEKHDEGQIHEQVKKSGSKHGTKAKGDFSKNRNLSTEYSLLTARDAITAILKETLQETNKTEDLIIDLSESDLDYIRKTKLIKSWSDWNPFMNEFLGNFSGAEGLRRVNAVIGQFDQFMISKLTAENHHRFSPAVLKFSEIIRLEERWPVFYDVRFEDWEQYHLDLELLTYNDPHDSELITSIISADDYHSRLKTMKVMSDTNMKNYPKLFSSEELQEFSKAGLSVPVIQRIDTIFQLSRQEMIKENSSYITESVRELQDFYEILRGRFVERPAYLFDTKSWFNSPEANLFISMPEIKDRFLSRLKGFLEEHRRYPVAYKIWEEGDRSPEFKLKPSRRDWEYQKIDGAEAMTCALFGLPLKHFAIMKNEMLYRRKPNDPNLLPNTLQWPKEFSEEVKPHVESFKRVYDFLGVQVLGLNVVIFI